MKEHSVASEKAEQEVEWSSLQTAPAPGGDIKMFAPRSGLVAELSLYRLHFLFPALWGWIPVAH